MKSEISISIQFNAIKKSELQLIKNYTGLSYADIEENTKIKNPIYLVTLKNTEFYKGVNELLGFIEPLKSQFILVNGDEQIFIEELQALSKLEVQLSDFR